MSLHDTHKDFSLSLSVWVPVCLEFKSDHGVSVADATMPRSPSCLDGLIFKHKWTTHCLSPLLWHPLISSAQPLSDIWQDSSSSCPVLWMPEDSIGLQEKHFFFLTEMLKRIWNTECLISVAVMSLKFHKHDWTSCNFQNIKKLQPNLLLHTWIHPPIKHNPQLPNYPLICIIRANQSDEGRCFSTHWLLLILFERMFKICSALNVEII